MSEQYSQAGPAQHRHPQAHGSQAALRVSDLIDVPQPPLRALLPPDTAEPPRRPSEPSEAWLEDALRSLPPAAQREALRQRKRPAIASLAAVGGRPAEEGGQDTSVFPLRRLDRIRSGASGASRESAGRSSQSSSKGRDNESSWMSRFAPTKGRSGPSSARGSDAPTSPPALPSSGDHLLSISKTKAARKQARRDARRAKKAVDREHQRRAEQGVSDGDDENDEIITLDGIEEEGQLQQQQQQIRLSPARSRRAAKFNGEIVDLPKVPPLDVPEANAPTATALAEAAKAARKPRRKLQFAPEQRRVRKVDLPDGYEAGELYRGLDEYVEAARERRRKERASASRRSRRKRAGRSSRGSRGSRSSAAGSKTSNSSSSSSSSSTDSSSSSSSSSSGSGHGLTIARLRAFFGDSSSSSSSSSSDSDSNSDSSSTTSSSSTSSSRFSSANRSSSRRRRSRSRTFSMSRAPLSKRGLGRNRSRGAASQESDSDAGSPSSSRGGPLTPYLGPLADLQLIKKSRTRRQTKRALVAAKRAKKREAQLIKEGRLPPKPSRSARAKAARARDMAGGVTEYQLFTPMALPVDIRLTHLETAERRPPQTAAASGVVYRKTMKTTSWEAVRHHFHVLRHYLKQVDGQGGDLGVSTSGGGGRGSAPVASAATVESRPGRPATAKEVGPPSTTAAEASFALEPSPLQLGEADFHGGDLSLPPPALELPELPATMRAPSPPAVIEPAVIEDGSQDVTRRFRPLDVSAMLESAEARRDDFQFEPPGDQEMEGRTGVRMSDLPLSPYLPSTFANDFGKGFGRSPRSFSPLPSAALGVLPPSSGQAALKGSPSPARKHSRRETAARPRTSKQQRYGNLFEPHGGEGGDGGGPSALGAAAHYDQGAEGAWWLNVQCPTYKDMQEISKLFPLHPLTVEDVLQQDPREKVDVFDKLGYYLVVIRAIDERYFRYTSSSPGSVKRSEEVSGGSRNTDASHKQSQRTGPQEGSEATAAASGTPPKEKQSPEEKEEARRSGQPSFELANVEAKPDGRPRWHDSPNDPDQTQTNSPDWHAGDRGAVTTTMTRKAHVEIVEGVGGKEGLEGVSVGANNLYLIVFAHGVISFSFDDVLKHTNRVMRRLLEITQPVELTADWIAHGLYDSVVDAFFPLLSFVQAEIVEIEAITSDPNIVGWSKKKGSNLAPKRRRQRALMGANPEGRLISVELVMASAGGVGGVGSSPRSMQDEEKMTAAGVPSERRPEMLETRRLKTLGVLRPLPFLRLPDSLVDRLPCFLVKRRQHVTISRLPTWEFQEALEEEMRKTAAEIDEAGGTVFDTQAAADQSSMLHRIADTRKIVTGLSRLLGPKNDAVKGLRKRLADLQQLQRMEESSSRRARGPGLPGLGGGREVGAGSRTLMARTEVSMYMSDVHDHILSMLNQLGSGEGCLSEIHFSYLSRIDNTNRKFRQGTDGVILVLATVTVTVLCMQFTTSLFSINVKTPHNRRETPGGPYFWWMGIAIFIMFIPPAVYGYVRLLYRQSKRKIANKREAR